MAPFMPLLPSLRTISAPYAFIIILLSTLMVSGITRITLYPLAVPTAASPIPVLPLVGSMIVLPLFRIPFSSASRIISFAILSLTLPAGLKYSSFANILALRLNSFSIFFSSRSGVPPMSSSIDE